MIVVIEVRVFYNYYFIYFGKKASGQIKSLQGLIKNSGGSVERVSMSGKFEEVIVCMVRDVLPVLVEQDTSPKRKEVLWKNKSQ